MRNRAYIGLLMSWFAVSLFAALALANAIADVAPEPPRYTSVRRLPDEVTLATLSNGLTVIVQENHAAPVATVRCFVKNTGSAYEGKNLGAGLSHVLEHVVAGGTTTHRTEKEIEQDHRHLRRGHQRLHLDRHDVVLHRLPRQEHHDGHRAGGRLDAARQVRAGRVRPRVEGRPPRVGRRRGRPPAGAVEAAASRPSTRPIPPATRSSATSTCSMPRRTRRSSTSTTSATCRTTRCSWSSAT